MNMEDARKRIESAIEQYGQHAAAAIDLVINEVRSDQGAGAANELIDDTREFVRNDPKFTALVLFDHAMNDWRAVIRNKTKVPTAICAARRKLACSLYSSEQAMLVIPKKAPSIAAATVPAAILTAELTAAPCPTPLWQEERRIIEPALTMARQAGISVSGPLSPDTAFSPESLARFDGVVAMYHDQGLIPVKLLAFHDAVNVTLGLPVIRTSPDHGTAFDIAGKNRANAGSMGAAIDLAIRLAARRTEAPTAAPASASGGLAT